MGTPHRGGHATEIKRRSRVGRGRLWPRQGLRWWQCPHSFRRHRSRRRENRKRREARSEIPGEEGDKKVGESGSRRGKLPKGPEVAHAQRQRVQNQRIENEWFPG